VKTGNTEDAGRCLVFTAAQSDMSMMGVLLHFTDRPTLYTHAGAALDGVFEHFGRRDWSVLDKPIAVGVDNPTLRETFSNRTTLSVHTDAPVVTTVDLTEAYASHVVWDEHYVSEGADGKKHLEHVVIAGAQVATLEITRGDEVVAQVPLYANQSLVPFGSNDMRMLTSLALLAAFLILLIGISIIRALLRRRRRRLLARASIASSHEVADSLPRQSHAQHTAGSSDTSHHKPSHMRS
jgi:D-alanyl-D-alanine carboxypeptidase (penicillin-binding protein 5/6)